MNVWFIHHYAVPPTLAGVTRPFSLAQELNRRGHHAVLIAAHKHHRNPQGMNLPPGKSERRESFDNVPFVWLRGLSGSARSFARVANMLVFALRVFLGRGMGTLPVPDIIMGNSPDPFSALAALFLARRKKIPFVLHLGDLWPQALCDIGRISKRHPFIVVLRCIEKYLYAHADAIVSPLPLAEAYIKKIAPGHGPVHVIPNGVDLKNLPPVSAPPSAPPFTVMYAGAHSAANDLDTLLDAIRILQDTPGHALRFHFVGSGPEKARLVARARDEGITLARFEEPVAKERIYEVLSEANAFVMCLANLPLFIEGGISPNKIFDYMAMARPTVLATPSANNPVTEAGAGIGVAASRPQELAKAFLDLAQKDPQALSAMGLRGRTAVETQCNYEYLGGLLEKALVQAQALSGRAA